VGDRVNYSVTPKDDMIKVELHGNCKTVRIHVNGILVYEVERKHIKFVDIEFMEGD